MSRLFFIVFLSLFIVVLPTKSYAVDEYQKYKRVCSGIHSLKINRPGFLDCRCDFNVPDSSSILISEVDLNRGEVITYIKDDEGKVSEGFVKKNCKATSAAKSDFECIQDWSGGEPHYRMRTVFRIRGKEIQSFNELIDKSTGAVFFDSFPGIGTTGQYAPSFTCYKKKSIFDFKMPWK